MAKIIELILTEERIGDGTKKNPVRMITQLFTKEGRLVAYRDNHLNKEYFAAGMEYHYFK